jgi:hypothetical protein
LLASRSRRRSIQNCRFGSFLPAETVAKARPSFFGRGVARVGS